MTGTNAGDFAHGDQMAHLPAPNNCLSAANLAGGGSCALYVTFTPSASGGTKETAKIVVNDNANNSPQTAPS